MPDSRFYDTPAAITLAELAFVTGAELADASLGERVIREVAPLGRAGRDSVSFLVDKRYAAELRNAAAGACFVAPDQVGNVPPDCAVLVSREPQAAYARASMRLHHPREHPAGAPPIHPEAMLEADVILGQNVVLGPGVRVGAGTRIGANSVIGPGVAIGRGCVIGANVTIGFALIGDGVRILSGAAIGEAGFGVAASLAGAMDMPQLGRVILQDQVTVGACSCIDRGAWDDTVVGENTKIDNLVQIAHNCIIGRNCALAAQTGISGSVTVGDGAQFGGKAGVGDHIAVGARTRLAAGALTMRDMPDGETWCGVPAKPIRKFMREIAWLARMADRRTGSDQA